MKNSVSFAAVVSETGDIDMSQTIEAASEAIKVLQEKLAAKQAKKGARVTKDPKVRVSLGLTDEAKSKIDETLSKVLQSDLFSSGPVKTPMVVSAVCESLGCKSHDRTMNPALVSGYLREKSASATEGLGWSIVRGRNGGFRVGDAQRTVKG